MIQLSLSLQLVELKNGETYNGHLVSCDNWMNINLREVICTSRVRALPCTHRFLEDFLFAFPNLNLFKRIGETTKLFLL